MKGENEGAERWRQREVLVLFDDPHGLHPARGSYRIDDPFHSLVGGGGSRCDTDGGVAFEPLRVDVVWPVNPMGLGASVAGYPHERLSVRAVLGADDEDERCLLCKLLHRGLSICRCIAEVAAPSRPQFRVCLLSLAGHAFPLVETERCLRQKRHFGSVASGEVLQTDPWVNQGHCVGCLRNCADRLIVTLVADIDDVVSFARHPLDLVVDLGDKRAHGVDHNGSPFGSRSHHFWSRAVGRQHERPAVWHLGDVVDEDNPGAFECGDDRRVVDDLVVAVHRRLENTDHPGQRLYGHLDAGAEPPWFGEKHLLWHGRDGRPVQSFRFLMSHPTILEVVPGSSAAAAGLSVGDELLAVNGVRPSDVIEYQQLVDEAELDLLLRRTGQEIAVGIEKRVGEPLGIRLNKSIFDRVQTCDNHCEFCFIYQLPRGMRQSLYLKDDDYRLSFLYGNFTTLTRFTELDLARVVEERLGPMYVSIHATDPDVRTRMLRNPRGATSLRWLRALLDYGVTVHGQIVLCPTVNGADVLERTCAEIVARYPRLASVGIVPLGVSQFNTGSTLTPHTPKEAVRDLGIIERWREVALKTMARRMFFASDELYLMAGSEFPVSAAYEDFSQHENGIGMVRAFYDELERIERGTPGGAPVITGEWRSIPAAPAEGYRALRHIGRDPAGSGDGPVVVVTGEYGIRAMEPVRERLERVAGRRIRLLAVRNDFFRGNVAVAGLIVGSDLRRTLAEDNQPAGIYLVPDVALQGDVFLDDVSLTQVTADAKAPVRAVTANVAGLLEGAAA